MSAAFSDDLSDPTPSPPPAPAPARSSSSKNANTAMGGGKRARASSGGGKTGTNVNANANHHQRTVSAASTATRGGMGSAQKSSATSHSRNTSLVDSLAMSQSQSRSQSVKGKLKENGSPSDNGNDENDEDRADDGSQSGSELSSLSGSEGDERAAAAKPKPKSTTTGRPEPGEKDKNNEDNSEDSEGEDEDEDEDEDEEEEGDEQTRLPKTYRTPQDPRQKELREIEEKKLERENEQRRISRPTRYSARSAPSASARIRGVIPAPMWDWAKKKQPKKPTKGNKSDNDEDDEEGEEGDSDTNDDEDAAEPTTADPPGKEEDAARPGLASRNSKRKGAKDKEGSTPAADTGMDNDLGDEDEPMLDTNAAGSEASSDEGQAPLATTSTRVPKVKVEPPPSATVGSFDVAAAPPSTGRGGARPKLNGRNGSRRSDVNTRRSEQGWPPKGTAPQSLAADDEVDQEGSVLEARDQDEDAAAEEGSAHPGESDQEEVEFGNRQEAIDALATLELKFALVRQRIYQDKMDELGKEEMFMKEGSHPEMLHMYLELDNGRDRRVNLAELKRKREVDLAASIRSNDEDSIWSWWMVQKDTIQAEMITETSRKRRRVERERRALSDPLRRSLDLIPPPPIPDDKDGELYVRPASKAILAVALQHPYARLQTLPQINRLTASSGHGKLKNGATKSQQAGLDPLAETTVMPTLSQLNPAQIQDDLDVLLRIRGGFAEAGKEVNGLAPSIPGYPGIPPAETGSLPGAMPNGGPLPGDPYYAVHDSMPSEYPKMGYPVPPREGYAFNEYPGGPSMKGGRDRDAELAREREKERSSSKRPQNSSAAVGYGGSIPGREAHSHGHSYAHNHRPSHGVAMDAYPSNSPPALGLQGVQHQRIDPSIGHVPLPPAPSTIPGSSSGKHHHHHPHHHSTGGSSSQHPSLGWEGSRREREETASRDRSHSTASRHASSNYPGSQPAPLPHNGTTGRPHAHSVSHAHQHAHAHYHPTASNAHSHGRSSSHTVHHHRPHSHTHTHGHNHGSSSSHLHVIHHHGPQSNTSPGAAGSASSWRQDQDIPPYPGHREPNVERDERKDRTGHPSLSHNPMPSTGAHHHPGYQVREAWADRDRELVKEREREERELQARRERERASGNGSTDSRHGGNMMPLSSVSSHPSGHVSHSQREVHGGSTRGSRSGSLSQPQYPGVSSNQNSMPRYAYSSAPGAPGTASSAYSPPSTAASRRNNSPPSSSTLLPPVPNTSSRYSAGATGNSSRAAGLSSDFAGYGNPPPNVSPTSSLNPPGFNPWSLPPRSSSSTSTSRPPPSHSNRNGSPPPPSSAGGGGGRVTLSPIVSNAPRPSVSPAPRPSSASSASLHAILQPPVENEGGNSGIVSPLPVKPPPQAAEVPMEVDPPQGSGSFKP